MNGETDKGHEMFLKATKRKAKWPNIHDPQAGWFLPLLSLIYYPFHTRRKTRQTTTNIWVLSSREEDSIGIQLQLQLAAVETSLGWTLPPFFPSTMQCLNCSLAIEFERETKVQRGILSASNGKWVNSLFKLVNQHLKKKKETCNYPLILVLKLQATS